MIGWKFIGDRLVWILQNSWGPSWGDNGKFYVYADTVGTGNGQVRIDWIVGFQTGSSFRRRRADGGDPEQDLRANLTTVHPYDPSFEPRVNSGSDVVVTDKDLREALSTEAVDQLTAWLLAKGIQPRLKAVLNVTQQVVSGYLFHIDLLVVANGTVDNTLPLNHSMLGNYYVFHMELEGQKIHATHTFSGVEVHTPTSAELEAANIDSTQPSNQGRHMSEGPIAAIVVGCITLVAAVAALVAAVYRRHPPRDMPEGEHRYHLLEEVQPREEAAE